MIELCNVIHKKNNQSKSQYNPCFNESEGVIKMADKKDMIKLLLKMEMDWYKSNKETAKKEFNCKNEDEYLDYMAEVFYTMDDKKLTENYNSIKDWYK